VGEKEPFLLEEMQIFPEPMEISMRIPKSIKNNTFMQFSNYTCGYITQRNKASLLHK
jgi:hypothetical protein